MQQPDKIAAILRDTIYWHGTGRYHYAQNGEVFDALANIVREKALLPSTDLYDLGNPMKSISFALLREYGLLYADMHSPTPNSLTRATSQQALATKYIRGVKQRAILWHLQSKGFLATIRLAQSTRQKLKVEQRWSKKIHTAEPSILSSFTVGSDIANNYPILIGTAELEGQISIAPYLSKHEVRVAQPVPLSDVTHFEVPLDRVDEVIALLKSANLTIPVIAIESAESAILK